jgi:hypothetical protein
MTKEIIFTLPAEAIEGATEAILLGDFNNWDLSKGITLKKQKDNSHKAVVKLEVGKTYQYRFLLNDGRWVNDYHAENYVPASGLHIDNCLITVSETLDIEQKPKVAAKPSVAKVETAKPKVVKEEKAAPAKKVSAKPVATKTASVKAAAPKTAKKEVTKKSK